MLWLFFLPVIFVAGSTPASSLPEIGSYKNPHPRPYERCEAHDLIKLSGCCNDVLAKLDDCKAGDLACECCALQHMDPQCYHLCPGNPSTNFLTVLYDDCAPLNDVNACNLPFKKVDGQKPVGRLLAAAKEPQNTVLVKSVILDDSNAAGDGEVLLYSAEGSYDEDAEPEWAADEVASVPERPKVVLVNSSNATGTYHLLKWTWRVPVYVLTLAGATVSSMAVYVRGALVATLASLLVSALLYGGLQSAIPLV